MNAALNQVAPRLTGDPETHLIEAARGGSKQAFQALVERYKSLVCAVAYAMTGNFAESEEIAQETFIAVWKRLPEMQEPDRFKGWLYGITRNKSLHWRREHLKQASSSRGHGDPDQVASAEPSALDRMISDEDEQVIWSALRAIPETYRVPLVLFYREHGSIEKVARAMDLTPNSVKWRLWRGRKILQDHVRDLIERTLARSRPGAAFTAGVIAALSWGESATATAATESPAPSGPGQVAIRRPAAVRLATTLLLPVLGGAAFYLAFARGKHVSTPPALQPAPVASPKIAPPRALPNLVASAGAARAASNLQGGAVARGGEASNVFQFDFEDGILSDVFSEGHLVATCPPRPGNRHCLVATLMPWWGKRNAVKLGFNATEYKTFTHYSPAMTVSFDYWLGADANLMSVEVFDNRTRANYWYHFEELRHETWAHASVRMGDFFPTGKGTPMEPGDPLSDIAILGGRSAGEPFYVDNIRVTIEGEASP